MTTALVLGSAHCLWNDLDAARGMIPEPDRIVIVNKVGLIWPHKVDAWVTYHPDLLRTWVKQRARNNLPAAQSLWSTSTRPDARQYGVQTLSIAGGSSGMLGAFVALTMAERVVLCGVPIDPTMPHFAFTNGKPWEDAYKFQRHWIDNRIDLQDRVKSMSGFTRELLGAPTREWLDGHDCAA